MNALDIIHYLNSRLNIKSFLTFSLLIFPLGITFNLLQGKILPQLKIANLLFYIFSYIFFAVINWIWSQKKFHFTLIFLSIILGIVWLAFALVGFDTSKSIEIFPAMILYLIMLPIFLISQFTTWTPYLIKYYSDNSKDTNIAVLAFLLILSIFGYLGLSLITQTIVGSPGFN